MNDAAGKVRGSGYDVAAAFLAAFDVASSGGTSEVEGACSSCEDCSSVIAGRGTFAHDTPVVRG